MESKQTALDIEKVKQQVEEHCTKRLIPGLMDFIRIPNLSQDFDSEYFTNGLA